MKPTGHSWLSSASSQISYFCFVFFPPPLNFFLISDGHCPVNYEKAGCYENNQEKPLAYPTRLFTDNNPESNLYSNVSTGFTHWDSYVIDLACRCASKAKKKGFQAFSLQNFGE